MPSKEQILDYLQKNGRSMAQAIADHFQCDRTDINRILYYQLKPEGLAVQDNSYGWALGRPHAIHVGDLFAEINKQTSATSRNLQTEFEINGEEQAVTDKTVSSVKFTVAPQPPHPFSPAMQQLPESAPEDNSISSSHVPKNIDPAASNAVKMLEFLEEWARALNKPLYDVRKDPRIQFSLTEDDTTGIAGLRIGEQAQSGSAWLRLERQIASKVSEMPLDSRHNPHRNTQSPAHAGPSCFNPTTKSSRHSLCEAGPNQQPKPNNMNINLISNLSKRLSQTLTEGRQTRCTK